MIGPFGRQGAAATLRRHCPQMTLRRCSHINLCPDYPVKVDAPGCANAAGKLGQKK